MNSHVLGCQQDGGDGSASLRMLPGEPGPEAAADASRWARDGTLRMCTTELGSLKSQGTGSTAQSRFGYLGGGGDPAFLEMLWSPRLH